ncbi:cubilin [Rhipicephalus sanguineus]|uniref:cubilin n=1 Tax=Rhipicephalus sanguineus TaxID=34632 RepID=UPI0018954F09|nr:cubilin [Rhipicephalus sanguineus]
MASLLPLAVGLALLAFAESCGKTLTRSGRLTSPGYPMSYPPNVRCSYTLRPQGPDVCAVELKFDDLDVDGHMPRCEAGDAVQLSSMGERFCGVEPPPPIVIPITAEGLRMEFYSNGQRSGTGFALQLTQIENSCPKKGSACGGTISQERSRLEGPTAAGGACLYLLRKFDEAVCQVQVRFQRFSVGRDGACNKGRLLIAGRSLCGTRDPDSVETFDFPSQTLAFLYQPGDKAQQDKFVLDIFQEKCDK